MSCTITPGRHVVQLIPLPIRKTAADRLRNGLLSLHKTLLDSERATYERDIARIGSSGELLKLVLYDPWFAWLHELRNSWSDR